MNTNDKHIQEPERILKKYIESKTDSYDSIEAGGIKIYSFRMKDFDFLIDVGEIFYNITIPSIHKVSKENFKTATKHLNNINIYSTGGSYDIDYETGEISLNYCLLFSSTPNEKAIEKAINKMLESIDKRLTCTGGRETNYTRKFPIIEPLGYPDESNDIFPFN